MCLFMNSAQLGCVSPALGSVPLKLGDGLPQLLGRLLASLAGSQGGTFMRGALALGRHC